MSSWFRRPTRTASPTEWARNEAALAGEQSIEETSGSVLAAARRRLDAARAAVFEAERAVRVPEIDRLDIEALENAHEAVLVAQDRADKRFGGDRARTEADRGAGDGTGDPRPHRLRHVRVVHDGYVDPTRRHRARGPARERRAELAAAEDALAALEEGVDAELALAALVARRRDLRGRGGAPSRTRSRRRHRVGASASPRRGARRRRAHAAAASGAGIGRHGARRPSSCRSGCSSTSPRSGSTNNARRRSIARALGQELGEVEAEFSRLREGIASCSPEDAADDDRDQRELDQARAAMTEAEQRLQHQSEVEAEVSHRKSNLAQALEVERAAVAAAAHRRAGRGGSGPRRARVGCRAGAPRSGAGGRRRRGAPGVGRARTISRVSSWHRSRRSVRRAPRWSVRPRPRSRTPRRRWPQPAWRADGGRRIARTAQVRQR